MKIPGMKRSAEKEHEHNRVPEESHQNDKGNFGEKLTKRKHPFLSVRSS